MDETNCVICGDELKNGYVHKLDCNHYYHYECLMKSFAGSTDSYNRCPLCRTVVTRLPIVNGLKKLTGGIHYHSFEELKNIEYENKPCCHILKSGKNKGQPCNKNCKIGYMTCSRHT